MLRLTTLRRTGMGEVSKMGLIKKQPSYFGSSWFVVEPVPPQRGDLANLLIDNVPV
jgi:hypothetical protein